MDALELLKADHDRMKSLYGQFKNESGHQQQVLLFENIKNEFYTHAMMEETVFYPAFKNYPEFENILQQSYKDHQAAKDQFKTLNAASSDKASFKNQVDSLMKSIDAHIQQEEGEFFAMVRKIMKRPERERLGRHMQAIKAETPRAAAA